MHSKKAMDRIKDQDPRRVGLANKILSWITFARRPLTILELRHAVAVKTGMSELNATYLPEINYMISICAGLVTVDHKSNVIRLIHYTTQEYLDRTQDYWFPDAQRSIASTCVTYLSFDAFEAGHCDTDEKFEERLQLNPFYEYAATQWGHHAYGVSIGEQLMDSILNLLESQAKVSAFNQVRTISEYSLFWKGYSQEVQRQMTGLHVAAYFGLTEAILPLLKNVLDPNVKDTNGRTPLLYAIKNGHEEAVQLLLTTGADVNCASKDGKTPLFYAVNRENENMVKMLLQKGADPGSKDHRGWTPLFHAVNRRDKAMVKMLLEKGANPDSKDYKGLILLFYVYAEEITL